MTQLVEVCYECGPDDGRRVTGLLSDLTGVLTERGLGWLWEAFDRPQNTSGPCLNAPRTGYIMLEGRDAEAMYDALRPRLAEAVGFTSLRATLMFGSVEAVTRVRPHRVEVIIGSAA